MSDFEEREKAFEAKFALDAEVIFKAEARRDKMLATWASEILGKPADEYIREVIKADLKDSGGNDVITKLIADLTGKVDEAKIREMFTKFDIEVKSGFLNNQ